MITFHQKWEVAVPWAEQQLSQAGFKALRTFDLQDARAGRAACSCPHHGTEQCNCQMVVLLVYGKDSQPLSLVLHGHDEITWVYIIDTPQQRADARLLSRIQQQLKSLDLSLPKDESVDPDPADLLSQREGQEVNQS